MARFAASGLAATALLATAGVCLTTGCSTLGYYAQSVGGHLGIVRAARPVADWLADPATPAALRERLALSQRLRDFAVAELGEPDNASYRRYADLKRPAAVWNVVAAPELGLTLKTWCFAVVGCIGYRGYFDEADAQALGAGLRAEGWEVSVYGVPAYSTLGALPGDWLADPLLNTFIGYSEGELARLVFHELAHQVVYAKGDTTFNESFATAVERIGSARWLARHASAEARAGQALNDARRSDFRALTMRCRDDLAALYASTLDDAAKRAAKAERMRRLRADYEVLKATRWNGYAGYDGWFARANNAVFGVMAAYNGDVEAFEALFEREGGDFTRFYAAARALAAQPAPERHAAIAVLAGRAPAARR